MAKLDSNPLLILHVEDEENDAILFSRACERAGLPAEVRNVVSAEQAKAYLLGEGVYGDRVLYPMPQVILLDLKMPRVDGFEFLKWLRRTEPFTSIPTLVFTASISQEDKKRAMAEGANSYFVKPATFDALVQFVAGFGAPPSPERWN